MKRTLFYLIGILALCCAVSADGTDLYRVWINSPYDAAQLREAQAEPLVRLNDGYLVLIESSRIPALEALEIRCQAIASGVTKETLALDARMDAANVDKYPLLFESGGLRLFAADIENLATLGQRPELIPIRNDNLKIEFLTASKAKPLSSSRALGDLDSLIALVEQSSLYSFDSTLQAFPGRVEGTTGNFGARDWIYDKFVEYGYDSVYLDPFATNYNNVVATKLGTRFPDHQIVVGGHFDAVPGSPGADDNGSGTSGVLELARILADIETDMTFVFVTFDAEETGLNGSYHYADAANAAGDNIVYMFNMDMIGSIGNDSEVTVYHGTETNYSTVYNWLADSLVGVTGYLSGNIAQSDHWPFTQLGITSTFIIEYNFSPVYHTYQDSTTFMNFEYLTKLVKSAAATCYYISQTEGPLPSLAFTYPEGLPEIVAPSQEFTFQVQVDPEFDGIMVPSTAEIHYNVESQGWVTASLVDLSPGLYEATLPTADCYERIDYYISAEEQSSGLLTDPTPSEPFVAVVATEILTLLADNFETDQGWVAQNQGATSGDWQRGVPVDDDGWDYDPATDGDGSGRCYLTQNQSGNTDIDGGAVLLTSPVFDMTGGGKIVYDYFLNLTNSDGADRLIAQISSNGDIGPWAEVARHDQNNGLYWAHHVLSESYLIGEGISFTSDMKLRFRANDDDPQSIVEAGVDGVGVTRYECVEPWLCGDIDNDGVGPNIADLVYLVDWMFNNGPPPSELMAVDVDGNGVSGDIEDLVYLVTFMFQNGPALSCP